MWGGGRAEGRRAEAQRLLESSSGGNQSREEMEAADVGRNGERSSFDAACSALSQYIKANGSVADLGIAAVASPKGKLEEPRTPATMVLLPGKEESGGSGTETSASAMDADAREPGKAQLTIFYGGRMLVFDGFPADRAKDLMRLASEGASTVQTSSISAATLDAHPTGSCENPDSKSMAAPLSNSGSLQREPKKLDLPIARKASLKRFLEKRKDRFHGSLARMKSEKNKSWLSLEL